MCSVKLIQPATATTYRFELNANMPCYSVRSYKSYLMENFSITEKEDGWYLSGYIGPIYHMTNNFFDRVACVKGNWQSSVGSSSHASQSFDFCPSLSQTISLNVDKLNIGINESYTVTWSSSKAHSCSLKIIGSEKEIDGTIVTGKNIFSTTQTSQAISSPTTAPHPELPAFRISGTNTQIGVLNGIHTISLECTGVLDAAAGPEVGTISRVHQVKIGNIPPAPTVKLTAEPLEIKKGEKATLRWQTTNAKSVFIKPDIGEVATSGVLEVSPEYSTRYTIEAIGEFLELGTARSSVFVKVTVPPVKEKPPVEILPEIRKEEAKEEAKPVTISPVFTTDLYRGMKNDDVKRLQQLLASDKDIYPEGLITGTFGPLTEKAVKAFQKKYGLPQVGRVGPQTRTKLQEVFAGAEIKAVEKKPVEPAPISAVFVKDLKKGMTGPDVRRLQQLLAQDKVIYPEGIISGYFGEKTEVAVMRFQLKYTDVNYGDPEFGMVGSKTRAKLQEVYSP